MSTITHPECGKSWTGLRKEHCPACHETFSGTSAGNLHRRGDFGIDRRCTDPADAGLVLTEGVWHRPGNWTR
jgi:hypothetical protein